MTAKSQFDLEVGQRLHQIVTDLFPLPRSNTGEGVRQTIRYLQKYLPVELIEVPSGTPVFDWTVPQEYRVREAYIADSSGHRIVDYATCNLQLLANSQPVSGLFGFAELQSHLITLPEELHPDWVPYRTAFFRNAWGFCVSRNQLQRLQQTPDEKFRVVIDSEFFDGAMTYGEAFIPGQTDETILIYTHVCHPSLANDNLSGIAVAALLGEQLEARSRLGNVPRLNYRIVFAPATIGAITWLHQNQDVWPHIRGGLILSLLGDEGRFTYKKSRRDNSLIDRAATLFFRQNAYDHQIRDYSPFGYDERQFGSPGVNLPIGCLMRTPNQEFAEYHTSGDNLDFVRPSALGASLRVVSEILKIIESNERPINQLPCCEPQLGERGLYKAFGEHNDRARFQEAVMWTLNLADGQHDLIRMAERSGIPIELLIEAVRVLREQHVLKH